MYKKLVRYDRNHFTEIDQICLKRMAQKLKELVVVKMPVDDQYQINTKLLPILDACLRGEITMPFKEKNDLISGNYLWDEREGLLPPEYDRKFLTAFAEFYMVIRGRVAYETEEIVWAKITFPLDVEFFSLFMRMVLS